MKDRLKIILYLAPLLTMAAVVACKPNNSSATSQAKANVPTASSQTGITQNTDGVDRINAKQANEELTAGTAILVDVRSKGQYDVAHAKGAVSIPGEEIANRLSEFPKDKKIITYCT
jgi:predicted sulfurtransferase